jgi:hypothetical protein
VDEVSEDAEGGEEEYELKEGADADRAMDVEEGRRRSKEGCLGRGGWG